MKADAHIPSPLSRAVYPSLWLVLALAAVGWSGANPAVLTLMLPLVTLSLIGGYYCHRQINRAAQVMRWLMVLLGFAIALPLLLRARLLMGMLIFIFFMLLALGFTLRQRREAYMMLLGSVGLMLYSASYAPDRMFNWLIPFWVLASVLVMMQLNIASTRAGMRELGRTSSILAVVPVALAILLLAWLLFWLLPRPDALNFSLFPADEGLIYDDDSWAAQARAGQSGQQEGSGQGAGRAAEGQGRHSAQGDLGLNQESRLGEGPSGASSPRLLLQVESATPVLLRTHVFDQYEAGGWRRTGGGDRYHRLPRQRFERAVLRGEPLLRQTIEVMAEMDSAVPHLPVAQSIELPSRVLREDRHGSLYLPDRLQPGVRYTVHSVLDHIDGRLLYPGTEPEAAIYRQLPPGHERLCSIAHEVGARREPLAAAQRIEHYLLDRVALVEQPFSRGLVEALERGQMTAVQRLSAFVLMQRCLGVSARVARGYQSSLQHPLTGRYQVSSTDATVWAEIWLERTGWLRFVVNAAEPDSVGDNWLEQARDYVQKRLEHTNLGLGERLGLLAARQVLDILIALRELMRTAPWLAALMAAGVVLVCGIFWRQRHRLALYRLQLRLKHRLRREPDKAAVWLFAAVEAWFARLEQPRRRDETARQYLQRLQQTYPVLGSLDPLLRAFQQQRYGQAESVSVIDSPRAALMFWHELSLLACSNTDKS
jgi:hypothetical protein